LAGILCAQILVIAVNRYVDASACLFGAGVDCASVIVVTQWQIIILPGSWVTDLDDTDSRTALAFWRIVTTDDRVAMVNCTFALVITRLQDASTNSPAAEVVDCTGVTVLTRCLIQRVDAALARITGIIGARVIIVAWQRHVTGLTLARLAGVTKGTEIPVLTGVTIILERTPPEPVAGLIGARI